MLEIKLGCYSKPFSPRREMNRLRDARHPMTLCTPFRSRIDPIRVIAKTLSGLGSMPRWETMKPKSMPRGTPNTHFLGLSFTPLARRQSNVILRSATRSSAFLDFTMMSSTYASMFRLIWSPNTWSIHHWYVALVFLRPNGIVT